MDKVLSVPYGNTVIEFHPTYSTRRKTVEIAVEPPGKVIVTAPAGSPDEALIDLVSKKAFWITQQLYKMRSIRTQAVARELINGESLLYQGRSYRLAIEIDEALKKASVKLDRGLFQVRSRSDDPAMVRKLLVAWYRGKAAEKAEERLHYFAPKLGVAVPAFQIKDQLKRWGSCTAKGQLIFNWRCAMAPAPILDYIVVHELCHLLESQHTARFWNLIRAIMPDYETRKQWLMENGVKLDL